MFSLIPRDRDTKLQKRHTSAHGIETINKDRADHRKQHMGKDENTFIAEDIVVDVLEEKEYEVRTILKKYEQIWSKKLCYIKVKEMSIDLTPEAKPLTFPPFRAGPKTSEL